MAGEITTAWDLIEDTVRQALAERTLTGERRANTTSLEYYAGVATTQWRGRTHSAPSFAAPRVA